MDKHPIQGGVAILSVVSCYRNQVKLQPCRPSWLACDFTYLPTINKEIELNFSIRFTETDKAVVKWEPKSPGARELTKAPKFSWGHVTFHSPGS